MSNKELAQWLDDFTEKHPSKLGYIISWLGQNYWLVNHGDGKVSDFKRMMTVKDFFEINNISPWAEIRVAKTGEQARATNRNFAKAVA